jgi:hypothetical protein
VQGRARSTAPCGVGRHPARSSFDHQGPAADRFFAAPAGKRRGSARRRVRTLEGGRRYGGGTSAESDRRAAASKVDGGALVVYLWQALHADCLHRVSNGHWWARAESVCLSSACNGYRLHSSLYYYLPAGMHLRT